MVTKRYFHPPTRSLPEGAAAQQVDFERDIVEYELLLVMDKYTAADVLREVSVYDTISKAGRYTSKVRRALNPEGTAGPQTRVHRRRRAARSLCL